MPHTTAQTTRRRTPRLALRRLGAGLALTLGLSASLALAAQAQAAPSPAPEAARASMSAPFRIATFNILGANHTLHGRNGFATYESRMVKTIALLERRQFGIVGFQEYQLVQHEMFVRRTEGGYGVYPGLEAGRRPLANSIVWRKSEWSIVEKRLYKIPYFRGKLVEPALREARATTTASRCGSSTPTTRPTARARPSSTATARWRSRPSSPTSSSRPACR